MLDHLNKWERNALLFYVGLAGFGVGVGFITLLFAAVGCP